MCQFYHRRLWCIYLYIRHAADDEQNRKTKIMCIHNACCGIKDRFRRIKAQIYRNRSPQPPTAHLIRTKFLKKIKHMQMSNICIFFICSLDLHFNSRENHSRPQTYRIVKCGAGEKEDKEKLSTKIHWAKLYYLFFCILRTTNKEHIVFYSTEIWVFIQIKTFQNLSPLSWRKKI